MRHHRFRLWKCCWCGLPIARNCRHLLRLLKIWIQKKKTPELAPQRAEIVVPKSEEVVSSFEQAVELFSKNREMLLYTKLRNDVWLSSFASGKIELKMSPDLPRDFPNKIADCLTRWTGVPWKILLSDAAVNTSLHEQEIARKEKEIKELSEHSLIAKVLQQFPGAEVVGVRENS